MTSPRDRHEDREVGPDLESFERAAREAEAAVGDVEGKLKESGLEAGGVQRLKLSRARLAAEGGDAVPFIVDEDPARAGRMYLGRSVHSPADVPSGGRVFVGLPPAVAAGICDRLARSDVEFIPPG